MNKWIEAYHIETKIRHFRTKWDRANPKSDIAYYLKSQVVNEMKSYGKYKQWKGQAVVHADKEYKHWLAKRAVIAWKQTLPQLAQKNQLYTMLHKHHQITLLQKAFKGINLYRNYRVQKRYMRDDLGAIIEIVKIRRKYYFKEWRKQLTKKVGTKLLVQAIANAGQSVGMQGLKQESLNQMAEEQRLGEFYLRKLVHKGLFGLRDAVLRSKNLDEKYIHTANRRVFWQKKSALKLWAIKQRKVKQVYRRYNFTSVVERMAKPKTHWIDWKSYQNKYLMNNMLQMMKHHTKK